MVWSNNYFIMFTECVGQEFRWDGEGWLVSASQYLDLSRLRPKCLEATQTAGGWNHLGTYSLARHLGWGKSKAYLSWDCWAENLCGLCFSQCGHWILR